MEAHSGSAAVSQMEVKSPKPDMMGGMRPSWALRLLEIELRGSPDSEPNECRRQTRRYRCRRGVVVTFESIGEAATSFNHGSHHK